MLQQGIKIGYFRMSVGVEQFSEMPVMFRQEKFIDECILEIKLKGIRDAFIVIEHLENFIIDRQLSLLYELDDFILHPLQPFVRQVFIYVCCKCVNYHSYAVSNKNSFLIPYSLYLFPYSFSFIFKSALFMCAVAERFVGRLSAAAKIDFVLCFLFAVFVLDR